MSNIYVHEPPTKGKVLLLTSVGDVEVELWSKEAPKTCRNFVQLCMEGYYDNTIFHRVVKDFIVQGGDPGGDGSSEGESIYGKPFADEFHSRLRFVRRGLVGMANSGVANDNTSHFFFTLGPTPELNNKNTIFGRVGGDTIYNMLRMGEGEVGERDRPLYPHKIIKTKILINPFEDIVPRVVKKVKGEQDQKPKSQSKATKNFALLSFGEEAEEEADEVHEEIEGYQRKGKSSHELLGGKEKMTSPGGHDNDLGSEDQEREKKEQLDKVKEKLTRKRDDERKDNKKRRKERAGDKKDGDGKKDGKLKKIEDRRGSEGMGEGVSGYADPDFDFMKIGELEESSAKRIEKIKHEARRLKRELLRGTQPDKETDTKTDNTEKKSSRLERDLSAYEKCTHKAVSGADREKRTLQILNKFKTVTNNANKLTTLCGGGGEDDEEEEDGSGGGNDDDDNDAEDDSHDFSWLTDKLVFKGSKENADDVTSVKVLDANVEEKERYDISDPRNSIVARRRKKKNK